MHSFHSNCSQLPCHKKRPGGFPVLILNPKSKSSQRGVKKEYGVAPFLSWVTRKVLSLLTFSNSKSSKGSSGSFQRWVCIESGGDSLSPSLSKTSKRQQDS
jgi:hypothetical protein